MNCLQSRLAIASSSREGVRRSSVITSIPSLVSHDLSAQHQQRGRGRGLHTLHNTSCNRVYGLSSLRPIPIPSSRSGNSHPQLQCRALYNTKATDKEPTIHDVFETATGTWQYIVADPSTSAAVIIDPVLDYEPATQSITTRSADTLLALATKQGYKIEKILETHAHADHLTAASYLQKRLAETQGFKPPIGIGKRIEQVQKLFGKRYGLDEDEYNAVFDELFDDDETFAIGNLTIKACHFPGHTPDHMGYEIGSKIHRTLSP